MTDYKVVRDDSTVELLHGDYLVARDGDYGDKFDGSYAERIADALNAHELRDWEDVRRQLERSTSPCGHRAQYAFTEDGGKHISCLVCVKAERDALKAKVDELEALVLPEPVSDAYTLSRKLLGRTLKGDQ